jgi:hypothetical protein
MYKPSTVSDFISWARTEVEAIANRKKKIAAVFFIFEPFVGFKIE